MDRRPFFTQVLELNSFSEFQIAIDLLKEWRIGLHQDFNPKAIIYIKIKKTRRKHLFQTYDNSWG